MTAPARFAGRRALVTGAASGIGRAVALRLAAEGASVVGVDLDAAGLDAFAAEAEAAGPAGTVATVPADVTGEEQVRAAVEHAVRALGGLDLSFHIAGGARNAPIVDMTEEDWDFTIALVQKSVFLCTKHAARAMTGGGAIVNVASVNARMPMSGGSPYATGKAGVEMFTRNAALELAGRGIRVNAVLPGLVDTPLVAGVLASKAATRAYLDVIPLGAPATPAQVAGPCLYLASDDAAYVTGSSLVVDGGWTTTGYPRPGRG